jgi:hypothetical protein
MRPIGWCIEIATDKRHVQTGKTLKTTRDACYTTTLSVHAIAARRQLRGRNRSSYRFGAGERDCPTPPVVGLARMYTEGQMETRMALPAVSPELAEPYIQVLWISE